MSTLFRCPVCSAATELSESPLAELSDAFSGYVQCCECGSSSHEDGFEEIGDDGEPLEEGDLF